MRTNAIANATRLIRPRKISFDFGRVAAIRALRARRSRAGEHARHRAGLYFDRLLALAALAPGREHEAVLTLQRLNERASLRGLHGVRVAVSVRALVHPCA